MTSQALRAAAVVFVAFSTSLGAQRQAAPPAVDLSSVVTVMKDSRATAAQKQRLAGKVYSGTVILDSVRLSPTTKGEVFLSTMPAAAAAEGEDAPVLVLRFAGKIPETTLELLRRGQTLKLRGTLKDITSGSRGSRAAITANFTGVVIEDIGL